MIGKIFKIAVFGESHGKCVGILIEGCPPGIKIDPADIRKELEKRKPSEDFLLSPRKEEDEFEIFSGVFNGFTTGAPITIIIWNKDIDSTFYEKFKDIPRPSHADYTARIKYFGLCWLEVYVFCSCFCPFVSAVFAFHVYYVVFWFFLDFCCFCLVGFAFRTYELDCF